MPGPKEDLHIKCGIEVHQELDVGKLFCSCSSSMKEENLIATVERKLRPVFGETGEVDRAALFEHYRDRTFVYQAYEGEACLVELDEEPPHEPNPQALDVALRAALMFGFEIPDVIVFMRKTVTDGSATSGFQRTAMVGLESKKSFLETSRGNVRLSGMSLEEDASRIIEKKDGRVVYSLSRLGIPLLEIGTHADISTPEQAKEVASLIGRMLRAFREVKRGLGTIRQDINVSIPGGARVEIKGWQDLDRLDEVVRNEALRQAFLLELRDHIKDMSSWTVPSPHDVTVLFSGTKNKLIRRVLDRGGVVHALVVPGLSRWFSREMCPGKTLGSEISDYAKSMGLGGIIHSDEDLQKYGLEKEFSSLSKKLGAQDKDLVLIVAGPEDVVRKSMDLLRSRIMFFEKGVPEETRVPNHSNATTSYARPLPGADRMYPETDVAPVVVTRSMLENAKKRVPESLDSIEEHLVREGVSREVARALASSEKLWLFLDIARNKALKGETLTKLASFFTVFDGELYSRTGIRLSELSREDIDSCYEYYSRGIDKGLLCDVVRESVEKGVPFSVLASSRIRTVSREELERVAREKIKELGDRPLGAVIGEVVRHFRGSVSGREVSNIINEIKQKERN